jgi:hypothetical protein
MPTPKPSSISRFVLNLQNCSDYRCRVARLNLDKEDDIPWTELIDESWNAWPAEKLRKRWDALKAKAKVDANATHRGEYNVYLSLGTYS